MAAVEAGQKMQADQESFKLTDEEQLTLGTPKSETIDLGRVLVECEKEPFSKVFLFTTGGTWGLAMYLLLLIPALATFVCIGFQFAFDWQGPMLRTLLGKSIFAATCVALYSFFLWMALGTRLCISQSRLILCENGIFARGLPGRSKHDVIAMYRFDEIKKISVGETRTARAGEVFNKLDSISRRLDDGLTITNAIRSSHITIECKNVDSLVFPELVLYLTQDSLDDVFNRLRERCDCEIEIFTERGSKPNICDE